MPEIYRKKEFEKKTVSRSIIAYIYWKFPILMIINNNISIINISLD